MTGLGRLRLLSWVEGLSLLALLCVAMPLKYALDLPAAVRVVGSVHGLLFLALVATGVQVAFERLLTWPRVLRVVAWSFVPLGFLIADKILRVGRRPPA